MTAADLRALGGPLARADGARRARPSRSWSRRWPSLPAGPVLDVAAGDGRNALWLASQRLRGHRGRHRAGGDRATATRRPASAAWRSRAAWPTSMSPTALAGLGPFAALVVVRFKPSPEQWARLLEVLRPGGRVLLCSFRPRPARRAHGFPLAYCLDRAELAALLAPRLRLLRWRDVDAPGEALAGSVWQRSTDTG